MGNTFSAESDEDDINNIQYLPTQNYKSEETSLFKQNNLIYKLCHQGFVAYLTGNDSASGNIRVPSYITHNSSKYIVISISKNSFLNTKTIKTIQFSADSEIQTIDENSFSNSSIESITIPESVTEIASNAFSNCMQLKHVEFHPNSKLQKIYPYSFSNTIIESISIPSNVEIIGKSAFQSCNQLKHIFIPNKSKLKKIQAGAFDSTLIESIAIPSDAKLENSWCYKAMHLNKVMLIQKNNSCLKYYLNDIVIGKSDFNSQDVFDVIVFCPRNIKFFQIPKFIRQIGSHSFGCTLISRIFIPNYITHINSGAFSNCQNLRSIEFQSDSQLKEIEREAFASSSIIKISIPEQVTYLKACSFEFCTKLKLIEVPSNSQLKKIDIYAFNGTSIESFFVPSFVQKIGTYAFNSDNLHIIEFAENSSMKSVDKDIFPLNSNFLVMIPYGMNIVLA